MRILEDELRTKNSIIDGRKFVSGAKKWNKKENS
jgi:hypothetical protein